MTGAGRKVTFPMAAFLQCEAAWSRAIERFDQDDRSRLASIVSVYLDNPTFVTRAIGKPSPSELAAIEDIIAGRRRPDRRGKRMAAVSLERKRSAVEEVGALRAMRDAYESDPPADLKGRPWTKAKLRNAFERAMEDCAKRYGVELETLEAWARPSRRGTK